ncbi:MAG: leucine-rich repeat domain-containing protein [Oscillospiraceae bacterium]|nr:leucine-rich repeat domain-containing protein [Oscillospiraceae bacterium]
MMIEIKANYPTDDEIFIPRKRELPKADIPAVELTERQAAELGWAFRKKSKSVRITNYHGSGSWLVIPSKIGGLPVNEIGKEAFAVKDISNAPVIEQVIIPDSVRKIGEGAFSRSEVRSVVFGDGVRDIPKESFFLCKRLEFVRLPAGLISIGESAFRLCKNLRYIILPESLRTIGSEAFFSSGLEGFASNNRFCLDDARAFALTPMHKKYKLVLRRDSVTSMDVFMVGVGASVKFPRTCVTLGKNAASAMCSLDFSECTNVISDDAFPDKRNSYGSRFFSIDIKVLVPPGIKHLYFPEYVAAWYTDGRPYTGIFEITEDPMRNGGNITLKPNSRTLPSWSVEISAEEIKIVHNYLELTIEEHAFNTRKLKRLEMHNVSLLGRIFSPFCRALREVSWSNALGAYRQYIPPVELIGEILHAELTTAFCEWEGDEGFYQFRRDIWDKIFIAGKVEYPVLPAFMRRTDIKELSQRDRILMAIDILRSTPEQYKAAPNIYTEYLRTHLRYAKIACEKIKYKYPEYGEYLGTIF